MPAWSLLLLLLVFSTVSNCKLAFFKRSWVPKGKKVNTSKFRAQFCFQVNIFVAAIIYLTQCIFSKLFSAVCIRSYGVTKSKMSEI